MSDDILTQVAKDAGMERTDVSLVADLLFRELHKRKYESEADDYVVGHLLHELSDFAWIHLYQFLVLTALRSGNTKYPDDVISDSIVQLQYLGGKSEWRKYFIEMGDWKMSSQYGMDKGLY
jgi:hypothetical protein